MNCPQPPLHYPHLPVCHSVTYSLPTTLPNTLHPPPTTHHPRHSLLDDPAGWRSCLCSLGSNYDVIHRATLQNNVTSLLKFTSHSLMRVFCPVLASSFCNIAAAFCYFKGRFQIVIKIMYVFFGIYTMGAIKSCICPGIWRTLTLCGFFWPIFNFSLFRRICRRVCDRVKT